SLGVLVGEDRPHGLAHGPAGEVLRRDELQPLFLAPGLQGDETGDFRIAGGKGAGIQSSHAFSSSLRGCLTSSWRDALASSRRPTGVRVGASLTTWGSFRASATMAARTSAKSSRVSFVSVSVGSIIMASSTTRGK